MNSFCFSRENLEIIFNTFDFQFKLINQTLNFMNRSIQTVLSIFAFSIIFFSISCDKDQTLTPNPLFVGNTDVVFQVKINGELFETTNAVATFFDGRISIAATKPNGEQVSILLDEQVVKTYQMNASGSNLLQYYQDALDSSRNDELYSSFFDSIPNGQVQILDINPTNQTISGNFDGSASQSPILVFDTDSVEMVGGLFYNVPYSIPTSTVFNFGLFEFDADGQKVEMNTATVVIDTGYVNADPYAFYSISSGTGNFSKSIVIKLDDSRYQEGMTTYFKESYTGPSSAVSPDSLLFGSYWTDLLGANPKFYDSQSGSLTINKIEVVGGEEQVSGVFSFFGKTASGADSVNITNGKFSGILR